MRLRVAVVIGSTREGRVGGAVGEWVADHAARNPSLDVQILDLADYAFPTCYPDHPTPDICRFVAEIDHADAFVIVTPEYNRSFPAALKQAIDYAYDEWHAKPVGFVSYGTRSDGIYAIEHLRTVFTELHTVTLRNRVSFDLLAGGVDEHGRPCDSDQHLRAVTTMLDQLTWWGTALRTARAAQPYVS